MFPIPPVVPKPTLSSKSSFFVTRRTKTTPFFETFFRKSWMMMMMMRRGRRHIGKKTGSHIDDGVKLPKCELSSSWWFDDVFERPE